MSRRLPRAARGESKAHAGAEVTEQAAADLVRARSSATLRPRVLALIARAGDEGLTAHEAWSAYCRTYGGGPGLYSIAPRLSALRVEGWLEMPDGMTRRPVLRAPARQVYRLTPAALAELKLPARAS